MYFLVSGFPASFGSRGFLAITWGIWIVSASSHAVIFRTISLISHLLSGAPMWSLYIWGWRLKSSYLSPAFPIHLVLLFYWSLFGAETKLWTLRLSFLHPAVASSEHSVVIHPQSMFFPLNYSIINNEHCLIKHFFKLLIISLFFHLECGTWVILRNMKEEQGFWQIRGVNNNSSNHNLNNNNNNGWWLCFMYSVIG